MAIHKAANNDHVINRDVLDTDGVTPLLLACGNGHSRVAKVLLRAGTDVTFKCWENNLTLDIACLEGTPPHVSRTAARIFG